MVDRRLLLAGAGALALIAGMRWLRATDVEAASSFELQKSDSEWRATLSKAQYEVLRLHRTEVPGSSPLNGEKRKGTFACAGCDLALADGDRELVRRRYRCRRQPCHGNERKHKPGGMQHGRVSFPRVACWKYARR